MRTLATGADTIVSILTRRASQRPSDPFLVFDDLDGGVQRRSYEAMATRAALTAGVLARHGIGRGDRIHVHLWNRPEFFDLWFGAAWLGAAIVPTNPLLTADELAYVVGHAATKLSVTQPDLLGPVSSAAGSRPVLVTGEA
ncbi:MAG TPA: AMP-binding protein, partial [Actinomycetota bacterium]|nr:AMP-binding protein [Actinomycetota bacterium]